MDAEETCEVTLLEELDTLVTITGDRRRIGAYARAADRIRELNALVTLLSERLVDTTSVLHEYIGLYARGADRIRELESELEDYTEMVASFDPEESL